LKKLKEKYIKFLNELMENSEIEIPPGIPKLKEKFGLNWDEATEIYLQFLWSKGYRPHNDSHR